MPIHALASDQGRAEREAVLRPLFAQAALSTIPDAGHVVLSVARAMVEDRELVPWQPGCSE